ncbi:MAG: PHP domain-containing protein [Desulfobacterales bacterium]
MTRCWTAQGGRRHAGRGHHGSRTMFGVVDFFEKATRPGIKPIIGCEFYVAPRNFHDKTPADQRDFPSALLAFR